MTKLENKVNLFNRIDQTTKKTASYYIPSMNSHGMAVVLLNYIYNRNLFTTSQIYFNINFFRALPK
jgi:hypothetical protein